MKFKVGDKIIGKTAKYAATIIEVGDFTFGRTKGQYKVQVDGHDYEKMNQLYRRPNFHLAKEDNIRLITKLDKVLH